MVASLRLEERAAFMSNNNNNPPVVQLLTDDSDDDDGSLCAIDASVFDQVDAEYDAAALLTQPLDDSTTQFGASQSSLQRDFDGGIFRSSFNNNDNNNNAQLTMPSFPTDNNFCFEPEQPSPQVFHQQQNLADNPALMEQPQQPQQQWSPENNTAFMEPDALEPMPIRPHHRQRSLPGNSNNGNMQQTLRSGSLPSGAFTTPPSIAGIHMSGLDINTAPSASVNVCIGSDSSIVKTSTNNQPPMPDHNNDADVTMQFNNNGAPSMAPPSLNSSSSMGSSNYDGGGKSFNQAMEKLCESMKRSAMSRSIVKQLSGRNLSKQLSGRNLSKQNSMRGLLHKQSSKNNLSRQNSASRLITKQLSGRNLLKDNSGRNLLKDNEGTASNNNINPMPMAMPIRRTTADLKFRLPGPSPGRAVPGRGLYRHKSANNVLLASNVNMMQQQQQQQGSSAPPSRGSLMNSQSARRIKVDDGPMNLMM